MYASGALINVFLVAALDHAGVVAFFRSDAEGSFMLLFFPSILFYIIIGAGLAALAVIDQK